LESLKTMWMGAMDCAKTRVLAVTDSACADLDSQVFIAMKRSIHKATLKHHGLYSTW